MSRRDFHTTLWRRGLLSGCLSFGFIKEDGLELRFSFFWGAGGGSDYGDGRHDDEGGALVLGPDEFVKYRTTMRSLALPCLSDSNYLALFLARGKKVSQSHPIPVVIVQLTKNSAHKILAHRSPCFYNAISQETNPPPLISRHKLLTLVPRPLLHPPHRLPPTPSTPTQRPKPRRHNSPPLRHQLKYTRLGPNTHNPIQARST